MTYHVTGNLVDAVGQYEEAARLLAAAGDRYAEVQTLCLCGTAWTMLGRLLFAEAAFERALQRTGWTQAQPLVALPIASSALIGLGELAYKRNDLSRVAQLINAGLELAKRGQVRDALFVGYMCSRILSLSLRCVS